MFFNEKLESSSNNTNKLSPQELENIQMEVDIVQIIQINLVLKNQHPQSYQYYPFK